MTDAEFLAAIDTVVATAHRVEKGKTMIELTPRQINHLAQRLRAINCEWAKSVGKEMDDWDAISEEKRDGYRFAARALAPALALPEVVKRVGFFIPEESEERKWCAAITEFDWQAHVAAVREIVGEP